MKLFQRSHYNWENVVHSTGAEVGEIGSQYFPNQVGFDVFPNPFNSSTTIRYSTGSAARPTRLAIYDLSGRVVAELLGNTAVTSPQVKDEMNATTRRGAAAGAVARNL